ncbi:MAG: nitroreductase family protein [Actinomycetota bacterium]|jgi:nitroreductase|nr:nitroreductase family protein [Actinomycetota bacterium]
MLKELVIKNRSYRRFFQDEKIKKETLLELVDLARFAASGMNRQVLRYFLSNDEETNNKINSTLTWAAYCKGWVSPPEGEKPSAFIVMLKDNKAGPGLVQDEGIAAQTILLGAAEKGLGGCMLGSVDRKKLSLLLNISNQYEICLVIAIGRPKEKIIIEEIEKSGDIKYYRDENQVHHVPKRKLEDIII